MDHEIELLAVPPPEVENMSSWISPAAFEVPVTPVTSSWIEHTPFALWLMDALRPRVLVELGTLHGVSFFTFCQGSARNGSTTRCFAVDTWQGDEHTGFYSEDVWRHVARFNERFSSFSTLLRQSFDEAAALFEDASIDLVHIDGLHTYEAVRHDFETWLPKLTPCGVVLLHDTNVYDKNFGVARLMRELERRFPFFEFLHGHGLGIVAAGGAVPPPLRTLISAASNLQSTVQIRQVYERLGAAARERLALEHEREVVGRLSLDIAHLQEDAAKRDAALVAARDQHSWLSVEADSLKDELKSLRGALHERNIMVAQQEDELKSLRGALHERNIMVAQQIAQREALLASTSWRVTAPLRFVRLRVPRILRHIAALNFLVRALRWRAFHARRMLASSGLFDGNWYLANNPDVGQLGMDPLLHFVMHGSAERRRASPLFDTAWYLDTYPDVAESGINPLLHYWKNGAAEGRDPNPWFDTDWYLKTNPDVACSGINALFHFERYGRHEGRWFNPQIDPQQFISQHPEIACGPAELLAELLARGMQPASISLLSTAKSGSPVATLPYRPVISVITPVYNVRPIWLRKAVASVEAQTYPNWQLCLCDDGSSSHGTRAELDRISSTGNPRIKVIRLEKNSGISAATNAALNRADGEFVAFLDNDDELAPHALEANILALNRAPDIDILYSDEDKLTLGGHREEPFYKPDWSPHFLREVMYVGHFLVARRSLVEAVGGLDSRYDGVQDFELMLRLSERTKRIHHIRDILYHWRRIPGSVADHSDAKPRLDEKQVEAVNAHLLRVGIAAEAKSHPTLRHRAQLVPRSRKEYPRISIVIPTKDRPDLIGPCLDSIFAVTVYPDFEVVVVDNGTTDSAAVAAIARHRVTRVDFPQTFNFSRANNLGGAAATGEILVLLNNDTEITMPAWLNQMLSLLDDPEVVAVGPLLIYPDGKVQHAGIALGPRSTADHVLRHHDADSDGYFGTLRATREVSAVTAACLMMRRADYLAVGGFDELFRTHYQDVDLCLRLRKEGRRILFTPHTRVIHHEGATRGTEYDIIDRELLINAWQKLISDGDPYSRWEPESRGRSFLQ
jgi:GT2 family glycosyltransferase